MADRIMRKSGGSTARRGYRRLGAGLAAFALLAAGCGGASGEVEIGFEQVGFFPSYEIADGIANTPGGESGYVLFRLTSIDNGSGETFVLNPNLLVSEHDESTREHAAHEEQLLGDSVVGSVSVESGESAEDLGCVVMVVRVDDAEETFGNFGGTTTSVDLSYETDRFEVTTVRETGNTGFAIINPANAESVKAACDG